MKLVFLENQLTAEEVIAFQKSMNWTVDPQAQWEKSLKNTLYSLTVKEGSTVAGMGRLLGDGAIYWYINDVYVLEAYQGKGIGKEIVQKLIEYVKVNSLENTDVSIYLMSAQGKEGFYEKLGFKCRPHGYEGSGMELELSIGD